MQLFVVEASVVADSRRGPRARQLAACAAGALLAIGPAARADEVPPPGVDLRPDQAGSLPGSVPEFTDVSFGSVAVTAAGFLTAFVVHEACHGVANLAGIEPPEEDLRALDGVSPLPRGVFAAAILGTAALDVARYFLPDSQWLPWVSRGTKVLTIGMVVAF